MYALVQSGSYCMQRVGRRVVVDAGLGWGRAGLIDV